VLSVHGVQLKCRGWWTFSTAVWNLWRGGRPDCLSSKKMSKSRHFQPTPVQTRQDTKHCRLWWEWRKRWSCEEREHETQFVSLLPSFLLVIIGYIKSIVLQQHMVNLEYYILRVVAT
jgi:hypothetical protein